MSLPMGRSHWFGAEISMLGHWVQKKQSRNDSSSRRWCEKNSLDGYPCYLIRPTA